jgi:GH15 family glucan-1,4-alpha-glucosidase
LDEIGHNIVKRWRPRQGATGYFHSQEGEWDANGEVLWALWRQWRLSGKPLDTKWRNSVVRAGRWIKRKRTRKDTDDLHAGLLPAGFSAEHLGNNDYYYWDDFWSVGGLHSAAAMCGAWGDADAREELRAEAEDMMECIETSLERSIDIRDHAGMSASPYRRMDSGAIGSLAVGYPLQLWAPKDRRLLQTVEYLLEESSVKDMFFQDMIHSGLNAYLTLHMAQVLMRAGDGRFFRLVQAVADSASPTGQWPEAVHPRTGGGCMGDGQHIWAVAEWIMMIRNMFVREEYDSLVLCGGIPQEWRREGASMSFGPTPTPWGPVSVQVDCLADAPGVTVSWEGAWREHAPPIRVALPGTQPAQVADGDVQSVTVQSTNR